MQLLQAVEQLAFLAEFLEHVGQELIGRGTLAGQPAIEIGLQAGEGLLGLAAAGGDAGQVEFQQGLIGRERLRLAEGRLGLGEAIGQQECLAEQFVALARLAAQQEFSRPLVDAETVGMIEGLVDAGELLGCLRILLREMVEAAQLQSRENIGGIFAARSASAEAASAESPFACAAARAFS